jgi:nucleoid DNA-binding protein
MARSRSAARAGNRGVPVKVPQKRKRSRARGNGGGKSVRSAQYLRSLPLSQKGKVAQQAFEEVLERTLLIRRPIAHAAWQTVMRVMRDALINGHSVKLTGVGTLEPYERKPAKYRDPTTGELKESRARKAVRIFTSPGLRCAMMS